MTYLAVRVRYGLRGNGRGKQDCLPSGTRTPAGGVVWQSQRRPEAIELRLLGACGYRELGVCHLSAASWLPSWA